MKIRNGLGLVAILALVCGCFEEQPQTEDIASERVVIQREGKTLSVRKDVYLLSQLLSDSAERQARGNARREKMRREAIARFCKKLQSRKDLNREEREVVDRARKSLP